jgi:hypothetical protein
VNAPRRATSPLPAQLKEDVIEHLVELLLAELARNPDVDHPTDPDGGPTAEGSEANGSAPIARLPEPR